MNQHEIEAALEFHRHEMDVGGDRKWEAFARRVEKLLGIKNLGGDDTEDGYSIDTAHDYFASGLTAEEYVEEIRGRVVTDKTREHERDADSVTYPPGAWRYVVAERIGIAEHQERRASWMPRSLSNPASIY